VPIVNPHTQQHLVGLGALLARSQEGRLMALHVALESHGRVEQLDRQKELLNQVTETLSDPDIEIQLIRRVDESAAHGIIHAAIENDATLILMGWRGRATIRQSLMGTILDEVIWGSELPVLVGRISVPLNSTRNVVMALPSESLSPDTIRRTLEVVLTIARAVNSPLLILTDPSYQKKVEELIEDEENAHEMSLLAVRGNPVQTILSHVTAQDLIVLPSIGSRKRFESSLGNMPEKLAAEHHGNIVVLHYKGG
jgi:nucleotide-binding universal stress UspA family protein